MRNNEELYLQFMKKQDTHTSICPEYWSFRGELRPRNAHFVAVWIQNCPSMKVRDRSRFTRCEICGKLDSAMHRLLQSQQKIGSLKMKKMDHLHSIATKILVYYKRRTVQMANQRSSALLLWIGHNSLLLSSPFYEKYER